MRRLAALVPKPRVYLTRFYGVLSRVGLPPNRRLRICVVPAKPGDEAIARAQPGNKVYCMTWADGRPAQRLKRVFAIDPNAAPPRNVRSAVARRNAAG